MSDEEELPWAEVLARVEAQADAAGYPVEHIAADPDDEDDEAALRVFLPAGRERVAVMVASRRRASALLQIDLSDVRGVADLHAIHRPGRGSIECAVVGRGAVKLRRLFPDAAASGGLLRFDKALISVAGSREQRDVRITLGPSSAELGLVAMRRAPLSLLVEGLGSDRHDDARTALETAANAVLFELDLKYGVALKLSRREPFRPARSAMADPPQEIGFPRNAYDAEPMTLYWYARDAEAIPLLQFLAFYQAIEFYFPHYSQAEVRTRLTSIVKNPSFDPHSPTQIGKLVDAMSVRGRSGFGDERSQLRATVAGAVDPGELRAFVADEQRSAYFAKKRRALTSVVLSPELPAEDLLSRTADRIYEIRCRIVHTKDQHSGEEVGLLLPFSREAQELARDIELAQLVARAVLVAQARPFSLGA